MRDKIIIIAFLFFSNCTLLNHPYSFDNKYLIYAKSIKANDSFFFANFYFADIDDTIFEVTNRFGHRNIYNNPNGSGDELIPISVPPTAYHIYTAHKKQDGVYFNYSEYKKDRLIKIYSFKPNDTINYHFFDKSSDLFSTTQLLYSVYTGVDTTISYDGHLLKCKKIVQGVLNLKCQEIHELYMERNSLLPILIKKYFLPYNESDSIYIETYCLRFTLNKSEVLSKEFLYPIVPD